MAENLVRYKDRLVKAYLGAPGEASSMSEEEQAAALRALGYIE